MTNRFCLMCVVLFAIAPLHVFAAEDLCPDLEKSRSNTPQDMAGVQADIERLTLCVERAKLLKQLDQVAADRQDMLEKVKNPGKAVSSGLGAPVNISPAQIPPLPVGSLPPLSTGAAASPLDAIDNAANFIAPEWRVRKIWGQNGVMRAQLSNGNGTVINVAKGDPLPDGASVETVSVRGVAISNNGKIKDLSWDAANDSAASGSGSVGKGSSSKLSSSKAPTKPIRPVQNSIATSTPLNPRPNVAQTSP